jgi:hypothetical protein
VPGGEQHVKVRFELIFASPALYFKRTLSPHESSLPVLFLSKPARAGLSYYTSRKSLSTDRVSPFYSRHVSEAVQLILIGSLISFQPKTIAAEIKTMAPPSSENNKDQVEKVEKVDSRDQPWKRVLEDFEEKNGPGSDEADVVDATWATGRLENSPVGPGGS